MKTAIIIGATGLIGKLLTKKLLADPNHSEVTLLVRKKLNLTHSKLTQLVVNFDELYKERIQANTVFCCLGTTIRKSGSKEKFKLVDYTYCLNAAKIARKNESNQFVVVTSLGADPNSMIFYNKVKGELERDLKALNFESLIIVRPSQLIGKRTNDTRVLEKTTTIFMQLFSLFFPKKLKAIKADKVANAMMVLSNQNYSGINIIESDKLRSF